MKTTSLSTKLKILVKILGVTCIGLGLGIVLTEYFTKQLGLSEQETAQKLVQRIDKHPIRDIKTLQGGRSKASLFLVTTVQNAQYVVRFFTHESPENRTRIIQFQKTASQEGYGPLLFYTSADEGVIVMAYLTPDPGSSKFYPPEEVSALLKKIHQGDLPQPSWTVWDRTKENLAKIAPLLPPNISMDQIMNAIDHIHSSLPLHPPLVSCHRDLNPANIIRHNHKIWAIDYDNASQDDPFLDLAITGLLHAYTNDQNHQLLTTYLSRSPTVQEIQQFNLYGDLGIVFCATEMLNQIPAKNKERKNAPSHLTDFPLLLEKLKEGKLNLESPENVIHLSLSGIVYVLRKHGKTN